MKRMDCRVLGVLVTYQPDLAQLEKLVHAIAPQLDRLLIVDNGSKDVHDQLEALCAASPRPTTLLRNAGNLGLAAAQNQGIRQGVAGQASHILLLDQDSLPAADMVAQLLLVERQITQQGLPVGALGPLCVDRKTGEAIPFLRFGWLGIKRFGRSPDARQWMQADFVIASGCLMPIEVFAAAGEIDEAMFIDQVDVEWCYRLKAAGLPVYGAFAARMEHSIGDQAISLFWGLRKQLVHGPTRLYYITRNRIWLYWRPYIPMTWKCQDAWRMVCKMALFSLFIPPRRQHMHAFWKACRDGLRRPL
ncbi:glycosyltransferase family 2 protein [Chitinimonas arctica]|uniref:Glycosyltransferase family 2 protein n=1 Tax=Chitinimonas arctica TaxID=2594795 RepID=A0A516SGH0_9NEIS|nr:glycosyltransferase family 2 protein [Chitinimonas arctica]QDQ27261.1 glycosyltransferase family 2 protein [Chitinimonas arctica]